MTPPPDDSLRAALLNLRGHIDLAHRHMTAAEVQLRLVEEKLTQLLLPPTEKKD